MRLFTRLVLPVVLLLSGAGPAPAQGTKYEAENGTLTGSVSVQTTVAGFSGTGYAGIFENDGDKAAVTFNLSAAGNYDLYIGYAGPYGDKKNILTINSNSIEASFPASPAFTETACGRVGSRRAAIPFQLQRAGAGSCLTISALNPIRSPMSVFCCRISSQPRRLTVRPECSGVT